ncbi:hypothetical protein DAEQUDRAFT_733513 [Daedalea quercina L-15889]|uniref:Fungal-type protein kinase domain-containing protein n=1 Tax=Daedalea quercina L-15889 TaxID=1314783 RepID=A0A165KXN5_9APHY|nr:hypothetical protein DAEQUDRAFT_733513 [Daedalea quercina L-15889]
MWYMEDEKVLGVLCDRDLAADYSNGDVTVRAAHVPHEPDSAPEAGTDSDKSKPGSRNGRTGQHDGKFPEQGGTSQRASQSEAPVQARYRTGTGPFMAMDLLRPGLPPLHKYRHDLESFFYLYIYAAAAYNPVQKVFGNILQWQHESLINVGDSKRRFLVDEEEFQSVVARAHEDFKPLVSQGGLLVRLWLTFAQVEERSDRFKSIKRMQMLAPLNEDHLSEMDRIEKERDELVTYSQFMEILQAPEDMPKEAQKGQSGAKEDEGQDI